MIKYFKIIKIIKGELINLSRAWDKENISYEKCSDRIRSNYLPNTWLALCPLSYETSWRAMTLK